MTATPALAVLVPMVPWLAAPFVLALNLLALASKLLPGEMNEVVHSQ